MLSTAGLWLALGRDKRGRMILGSLLGLIVLAVLVWNLIP